MNKRNGVSIFLKNGNTHNIQLHERADLDNEQAKIDRALDPETNPNDNIAFVNEYGTAIFKVGEIAAVWIGEVRIEE